MAYTTTTQISNFLKRSLTSDETAFATTLIPAVGDWIDSQTGTTFDVVSPTTRYYDGGNMNTDIDPCTEISAISVIDDYGTTYYTLQSYEYIAEPANFNVKTQIRYRWGKIVAGAKRIAVTAKFSSYDGGIPEDIQLAATRLCAALFNNREATGLKREALEGHSVEYDFTKFASEDSIVSGILQSHKQYLVD